MNSDDDVRQKTGSTHGMTDNNTENADDTADAPADWVKVKIDRDVFRDYCNDPRTASQVMRAGLENPPFGSITGASVNTERVDVGLQNEDGGADAASGIDEQLEASKADIKHVLERLDDIEAHLTE